MLEDRQGKRVPEVTFRARENDRWVELDSRRLFDGRTVVLFGDPYEVSDADTMLRYLESTT